MKPHRSRTGAAARACTGVLAALVASCALVRARAPEYERVTLASGVVVEDLIVPEDGPLAREGDRVRLHYELSLADGTPVDSSWDRGQPIETRIGDGLLPPGIEEAIVGMRLYGRRQALVPSARAYGSEGLPPRIPPDTDLHCVFELMGLELGP